MATTGIVR